MNTTDDIMDGVDPVELERALEELRRATERLGREHQALRRISGLDLVPPPDAEGRGETMWYSRCGEYEDPR